MLIHARRKVVIDTSVLINFLVLEKGPLLGRHPEFDFVVTEHVSQEVADFHNPALSQHLDQLLAESVLSHNLHYSIAELHLFAELRTPETLGAGECAAIAVAVHRNLILAIDDKAATREFLRRVPDSDRIENTASLVVGLIRGGVLSVAAADQMKAEWESRHRFKIKANSFADLV